MSSLVPSHLKDMNRMSVYQLACQLGETSKAELARLSGISKPTVIRIVNFLVEQGFLLESGEKESTLGRKPQMLRLNKNHFLSVGVLYEGDSVKLGLVNLSGEIVLQRKISGEGSFGDVIGKRLTSAIDAMLSERGVGGEALLGIGIGIPAVYDVYRRYIITAPLIGIHEMTDIGPALDRLAERYGCPVIADNDLNMEVLGEFHALGLGEKDDLIYLSLGTGFGGGIILNGSLRRGNNFMCGEIGYMVFMDDHTTSKRSTGWLEQRINLKGLQKRFDILSGAPSAIADAIEYVAGYMSLCVNSISVCLDCQDISLGGEVFDVLGPGLMNALREKTDKLALHPVRLYTKQCREPGVIGAANLVNELAVRRILFEQSDLDA